MTARTLLDACVLVPDMPRALLLAAAGQGLLTPLWSVRIFEEWRRAALRRAPETAAGVAALQARLTADWPGACIPPAPQIEARLSLPDAGDIHVLAAAIAGGAAELVTFNVADFPGRTLARDGIVLRHPDGLLVELLATEPAFAGIAEGVLARLVEGSVKAALKRAKLPRLARALTAAPRGAP